MAIQFTQQDKFLTADVRDIMNFVRSLTESSSIRGKEIWVNDYRLEKELNSLMVNVTIDFQIMPKTRGRKGLGELWSWKCYRASEFSCMNIRFLHREQPEIIKEVAD